jgi:hypothetical protein
MARHITQDPDSPFFESDHGLAPSTPGTCPQAWHGGLPAAILIECALAPKHRGWHRAATGDLQWGGKLTPDEHELADQLRENPTTFKITTPAPVPTDKETTS